MRKLLLVILTLLSIIIYSQKYEYIGIKTRESRNGYLVKTISKPIKIIIDFGEQYIVENGKKFKISDRDLYDTGNYGMGNDFYFYENGNKNGGNLLVKGSKGSLVIGGEKTMRMYDLQLVQMTSGPIRFNK